MSQTALEIVGAMSDVLFGMKARDATRRRTGRELMSLLEVRDLARDGQALARRLRPSSEEDRDAWELFRIGMTYLELDVHNYIAIQPDSTPDEDQDAMNRIAGHYEEVAQLAPRLSTLVDMPTDD